MWRCAVPCCVVLSCAVLSQAVLTLVQLSCSEERFAACTTCMSASTMVETASRHTQNCGLTVK
jgi:hypothetical protein